MSPLRLYGVAFPMPLLGAITFLLSALAGLSGCSLRGDEDDPAVQQIMFLPAKVSISAEVANTELTRERGLMHRTHLGENAGMIFYFDRTGYYTFYMYNTRIPLTVIFLNEDLKVVDMQDMAPCPEQNPSACPLYPSRAPCKYAIEVNQGFVQKNGIKVGDLAKIGK